mmetsp:Transcript_18052/g.46653  ORF Transcript_18052/g.46653 Transcript_18052/m.46653 type:complete len:253 (-) Transcript_18052:101-859(-)
MAMRCGLLRLLPHRKRARRSRTCGPLQARAGALAHKHDRGTVEQQTWHSAGRPGVRRSERHELLVDDVLVRAHLAMCNHRAKRVDDDAQSHQACDIRHVVWRRNLDNLHAAQPLLGDEADKLERLAREQATRLGPARAGDEGCLKRINVVAQVHRIRAVPRAFERHLRNLVDAELLDVAHREHVGAPVHDLLNSWPRHLPAADTDLHEVERRDVGQVRRVEPGRRVHALVEVRFLNVGVPVDVDNSDLLCCD